MTIENGQLTIKDGEQIALSIVHFHCQLRKVSNFLTLLSNFLTLRPESEIRIRL